MYKLFEQIVLLKGLYQELDLELLRNLVENLVLFSFLITLRLYFQPWFSRRVAWYQLDPLVNPLEYFISSILRDFVVIDRVLNRKRYQTVT